MSMWSTASGDYGMTSMEADRDRNEPDWDMVMELEAESRMDAQREYCPGCGAVVPSAAAACPGCGRDGSDDFVQDRHADLDPNADEADDD